MLLLQGLVSCDLLVGGGLLGVIEYCHNDTVNINNTSSDEKNDCSNTIRALFISTLCP